MLPKAVKNNKALREFGGELKPSCSQLLQPAVDHCMEFAAGRIDTEPLRHVCCARRYAVYFDTVVKDGHTTNFLRNRVAKWI